MWFILVFVNAIKCKLGTRIKQIVGINVGISMTIVLHTTAGMSLLCNGASHAAQTVTGNYLTNKLLAQSNYFAYINEK